MATSLLRVASSENTPDTRREILGRILIVFCPLRIHSDPIHESGPSGQDGRRERKDDGVATGLSSGIFAEVPPKHSEKRTLPFRDDASRSVSQPATGVEPEGISLVWAYRFTDKTGAGTSASSCSPSYERRAAAEGRNQETRKKKEERGPDRRGREEETRSH